MIPTGGSSTIARRFAPSDNAHDNEMLSIIEELREAGLIIIDETSQSSGVSEKKKILLLCVLCVENEIQ